MILHNFNAAETESPVKFEAFSNPNQDNQVFPHLLQIIANQREATQELQKVTSKRCKTNRSSEQEIKLESSKSKQKKSNSKLDSIEAEIKNFDDKKMLFGIFGAPSAGKSFLINHLIGDLNILPTKVGDEPSSKFISDGCTEYPVVCAFHEENQYVIDAKKDKTSIEGYPVPISVL